MEEFKFLQFCCMYQNCSKSYKTKYNLKKHVEIHHLYQRKHYCEVCGKHFVSKLNYKEHLNIHTGVMPYKCSECDERFRQLSSLSLHKRTHRNQFRPFGYFLSGTEIDYLEDYLNK